MLLLAATAGGTALITGLLRQKWVDAFAWEKKHHATADRLSAALDQLTGHAFAKNILLGIAEFSPYLFDLIRA